MDSKSTTYITAAAVTIAAGLAVYAVYFDYKRRNDVEFRKKLKKEKKRVQKAVAESKQSELADSTSEITPASLREVLKQVREEPGPQSPEEKEQYFMNQVSIGEQLAAQGPKFYLPAATAFFRALRVYPAPVELIVIYEKTIIPPVFKLIMELSQLDVKYRIEAYFDNFPPKGKNVSVVIREVTPGQGNRHILVADKDFAAGEVIYKEFPVVTALDPDLQEKGTHCDQCLRPIQAGMSIQASPESSPLKLSYCSKACMLASKSQHHSLLFTLDPALPPEIPSAPATPELQEARREAQAKLAEHITKERRLVPLLVARFIARQVAFETQKLVQATAPGTTFAAPEADYTDSDNKSEKYVLADHIERLRYLETVPNKDEFKLLRDVLAAALPGLEEFISDDKYATLCGKMAYNAFGVCFGGGRDDRPVPDARPENIEKTRTPYGTQRQIGSALYTVSSYLTHSCQPSARPSFSSGTSEISIIANKDIKKGDVLTVAFVDVAQHPDETVIECRRRRRFELARGWRFSCNCERCVEEAATMTAAEKSSAPEDQKDESKVESSVDKYTMAPKDDVE
ncbi:MAS20-domain-containing protein [Agrocybe pediades]|nr:MAS20-domain-containing protein [Agrocybe pediades]